MISRFFTKNIHIKLLALGAACVFWFFVLSSENTFYAFPDKINLEPFNVPEGLAVVNELGTAEITVRASQEVYKTLTPENFTVYVDLKGLAAGSKQVDVSVNSKKTDVSVISVYPESITVILEELTTKEIPLTYVLAGDPADNYEATLEEFTPSTVQVSGAESVLSEIDTAVATLTLQGNETVDTTRSAEITIFDTAGDQLTTVTANPKTIDLTALVNLAQSQKTVGIKVQVEDIETGYLSEIKVSPSVVQIQGDAELLETVMYLETEPINIPAGTEVYKTEVSLILPEGVILVDQETIETIILLSE